MNMNTDILFVPGVQHMGKSKKHWKIRVNDDINERHLTTGQNTASLVAIVIKYRPGQNWGHATSDDKSFVYIKIRK